MATPSGRSPLTTTRRFSHWKMRTLGLIVTGAIKQQKLGTDCGGCHRADDPHGGSLGKACETCHSATKWSDVAFDHDLTAYPLLGLHVAATCGQCHENQHFKETPQACIGCHAKEDVHKGELGKDCGACHTPNGWK